LKKISTDKFAKMIVFLRWENGERTNNHVERNNRVFRMMQKTRYKRRHQRGDIRRGLTVKGDLVHDDPPRRKAPHACDPGDRGRHPDARGTTVSPSSARGTVGLASPTTTPPPSARAADVPLG
jgi:hypothetical protein